MVDVLAKEAVGTEAVVVVYMDINLNFDGAGLEVRVHPVSQSSTP